jgi:nitrogen fixation NifU-like protein
MAWRDSLYSHMIWDHYKQPRNVGVLSEYDPSVGTGKVGTLLQGDVLQLQIKVAMTKHIEMARFKMQGGVAGIAAASLITEWVQGKSVQDALAIHSSQIADALALAPVKIHCAVLAEQALQAALADWQAKQSVIS